MADTMPVGKGAWGKGGEKGGKQQNPIWDIDSSQKVWIGGLPSPLEKKELTTHFEQAGTVQCVEIMKNGTACVAYETAEDVQSAIGMLNGSSLGGQAIEVDVWATKPKAPGGGGGKGSKGPPASSAWGLFSGGKADGKGWGGGGLCAAGKADGKGWGGGGFCNGAKAGGKNWGMLAMMQDAFTKMYGQVGEKGGGKGNGKKGGYNSPIWKTEASLRVWVGGLPEGVNKKELEAHFQQAGETSFVEVMRGGKACVAYNSPEDVEVAIATLNGVEFEGHTLEVDSWTTGGGKGATAAAAGE